MVKVKAIKNSIEIKCKPLVPSDFKYKLLTKLSFNYILKSDGKRLLKIDKNEITEEKYDFKVGDDVYIKDYDQYGVINKIIKKDLFSVSIGNIVANFKQNELKLVKPNKQKAMDTSKNISFTKKSTVKLTLDLRGCRYEEAKDLLDEYIDDLVCSNIKQANIIHGYGTGVIRELVQNFLKRSIQY